MASIGVDVVSATRIERDCAAWGVTFSDRVLSPVERAVWASDPAHIGAAVALKEAVFKATATRLTGRVGWHDVELGPVLTEDACSGVIRHVALVTATAFGCAPMRFTASRVHDAVDADGAWGVADGTIVGIAVMS